MCSVGIENSTGSDGLEVVFNANYLHDDLAILFEYAQPWLTVEPRSGSVVPLDADILDVTFNSSGLSEGDYTGTITVNSNDPDESSINIPVTMHVDGSPPDSVTDLTVWRSGDDVILNWTPTNADEYHLYISDTPDTFAGAPIVVPAPPYTIVGEAASYQQHFYQVMSVKN